MHNRTREVVSDEGTALATFLPGWIEHEVINDELASALEKIAERAAAVRSFEDVVLADAFPRQFASLPAQFVPFAGEFLFGGKVRQPRLDPFVARNYFVLCLCCSHRITLSLLVAFEFTYQGYARTHVSSMLRAALSVSPFGGVSSFVVGAFVPGTCGRPVPQHLL